MEKHNIEFVTGNGKKYFLKIICSDLAFDKSRLSSSDLQSKAPLTKLAYFPSMNFIGMQFKNKSLLMKKKVSL
jgi:hypothetical protein